MPAHYAIVIFTLVLFQFNLIIHAKYLPDDSYFYGPGMVAERYYADVSKRKTTQKIMSVHTLPKNINVLKFHFINFRSHMKNCTQSTKTTLNGHLNWVINKTITISR